MANHKSAKKRSRQTLKRTATNKARLTKARTAARHLRKMVEGGELSGVAEQLVRVQGLLARTNLSPRAIARRTSRMAKFVSSATSRSS